MGAVLKFSIEFPVNYPGETPQVVFQTFEKNRIWHPNVDEMMGFLDLGENKSVNQIIQYIGLIFSDNFKIEGPYDKFYNPVAAK